MAHAGWSAGEAAGGARKKKAPPADRRASPRRFAMAVVMTREWLKALCRENKQYTTPGLNDTLHLHFKAHRFLAAPLLRAF
jgi:hypothetical protein